MKLLVAIVVVAGLTVVSPAKTKTEVKPIGPKKYECPPSYSWRGMKESNSRTVLGIPVWGHRRSVKECIGPQPALMNLVEKKVKDN